MSEDQGKSEIEELEYPALPPELSRPRFSTLFKYFGPGAIIASITIGSGETVFASRSGAVFGYSLLWLFLAAAIAKGLQIYCGSRYITLTGEHPLRSWNRLPLLRGWFPWLVAGISILCFPLWLGGLPPMLGQLVNWIVGIPDGTAFADEKLAAIADESFQFWVKIWGTAFVLVAVSITLLQSYKLLEKVQTLLVGLLLLSLLAAAMAGVNDRRQPIATPQPIHSTSRQRRTMAAARPTMSSRSVTTERHQASLTLRLISTPKGP